MHVHFDIAVLSVRLDGENTTRYFFVRGSSQPSLAVILFLKKREKIIIVSSTSIALLVYRLILLCKKLPSLRYLFPTLYKDMFVHTVLKCPAAYTENHIVQKIKWKKKIQNFMMDEEFLQDTV